MNISLAQQASAAVRPQQADDGRPGAASARTALVAGGIATAAFAGPRVGLAFVTKAPVAAYQMQLLRGAVAAAPIALAAGLIDHANRTGERSRLHESAGIGAAVGGAAALMLATTPFAAAGRSLGSQVAGAAAAGAIAGSIVHTLT